MLGVFTPLRISTLSLEGNYICRNVCLLSRSAVCVCRNSGGACVCVFTYSLVSSHSSKRSKYFTVIALT